jgi:hypothetical protein
MYYNHSTEKRDIEVEMRKEILKKVKVWDRTNCTQAEIDEKFKEYYRR